MREESHPGRGTSVQAGADSASRVPFAALRHRDFRLFWGGLVLSGIGSQFTTVAMAWQIYELTDSALQLGLLGLARGVPQIGLLLVGGLLADAVDRRRLMMMTQVGQFAVSAALVGLTVTEAIGPLALYVASFLLAIFSSLEGPARQALVPNMVPRSDLTNAVALNATQRNVSMIAGPSLAGLVLGASGPALCYAVDTVSWVAMLGALVLIRSLPQPTGGRGGLSLGALREGFAFVWSHPIILSLMVLDFGQNLFGNPRALMPVYARDILHVGPEGLGLLYAAAAVGSIAMAAGMSVMAQVRRAGRWVLIGVGVYAASTALFGISQIFWFSLLLLAAEGAGNMISTVLRGTMTQLVTPDELRGRVTSVNNVFTNSGPQLGQFRAGAVAEVIGAELSVVTGAVVLLAIVAGVAVGARAVRRFEIREGG